LAVPTSNRAFDAVGPRTCSKRLGYEAAAVAIQDHFLAGRRKEAEAAVTDALIDEISLVGSKERVQDRLQAWKDSQRTTGWARWCWPAPHRQRCASSPKPYYEGLLWGGCQN
jgi:alkanesulfonate monooxygenase SsuD/methylene tetrahydromethanopterin reductase-like flavin-dependent oxidoreductase (luciferase family)